MQLKKYEDFSLAKGFLILSLKTVFIIIIAIIVIIYYFATVGGKTKGNSSVTKQERETL